jgi:hypothetical protein
LMPKTDTPRNQIRAADSSADVTMKACYTWSHCQHFQKSIYLAKNPLSQGNVAAHCHMPGDAGMTFEKIRKLNEDV